MYYKKIILRFYLLTGIFLSFTLNVVFSQNLVKNPGFETGVFSPNWSTHAGSANSSVTITTYNVFSGNYCAKLTGANANLYQSFNFEPNTTYKLTATIKTESGQTAILGAKDYNGNEDSLIFSSTNFKTDSLIFTTGEYPGNNPQIYIKKSAGLGSVWVDNLILTVYATTQIPDLKGGEGTYYIRPTGNDSNSGTSPGEAWQSINKVNHINFEPGDTILFEGGETFVGNIRFNYNDTGTADSILHLGSYGTGRAIIDAGSGPGLTASDCEYLSIKNLNFTGAGRNYGNESNGITFSFCSNIIVDSVDVSGFQHSGLTAKDIGENYSFTNVYAHDNGFAGIFIAGPDRTSLSNIYIGYCVADNNPGDPTVLNNHSGSGILAYNAKNITIEYCRASYNGWDMPRIGNGPGGIWVAEVDSAVIQHCISHDNKTPAGAKDGVGFDLDGGTTNSIIQYCLSYNNYGAGFGIYQYVNATDWRNNTIRYCISENDGNVTAEGSVEIWNGTQNGAVFTGLQFYNNLIYNANGPALGFLDHFNSNFNFRNNIFVSKSDKIYDRINGENFQGNNWYSLENYSYQDSVNFVEWALANTKEMLNGEIVGIYANPKLVNPGNSTLTDPMQLSSVNDYKVEESSKVIDSGLDLQSLFNIDPGSQDYYGNPLNPGQSFDMGIYQYLDKQNIVFKTGWNIMSLRVMPEDKNLMNILQPMISEGKLKKVMDEEGKVIEDWGSFGGWQNKIGDTEITEGYKINVTSDATLNAGGIPVELPLEILLNSGWNIISWPSSTEQDGMDVFQTLIKEGKLKKVMDQFGNVIEDWGSFGGWTNSIGTLKPGEGYKVNVSDDCTLSVNQSGNKSQLINPEIMTSTHFIPAYKGNGTDHMNINLVNLAESGIMEGDEIGVFDGNVCVGSAKIFNFRFSIFNFKSSISIPVSASDEMTESNGFAEGNTVILKLYRNGNEFPLNIESLNNSEALYKKGGSLFAQIVIETGSQVIKNNPEVKCYPNPFSGELTIEILMSQRENLNVEIFDALGRKVVELYNSKHQGKLTLIWNGKNDYGQNAVEGVYFIHVNEHKLKLIRQ